MPSTALQGNRYAALLSDESGGSPGEDGKEAGECGEALVPEKKTPAKRRRADE
eukprot:CAMPEP_0168470832 /NCGR_PEP_ID=MMETSP0228-20121227/58951_1 /TAXON_ID=133427 /ORGANISM="Protoceratium reticulatum, Strain CCCM 535 (=CCMP 1889)" /LENGTH=52 /DNA_ID=CAMNT_0008486685 /DNA_START=45 /DNA_END=200 /DNA_ORIENTATION=+